MKLQNSTSCRKSCLKLVKPGLSCVPCRFKKARRLGLKVQAVMSFHAGGGNVGDGSTDIPLPPWVMEVPPAV